MKPGRLGFLQVLPGFVMPLLFCSQYIIRKQLLYLNSRILKVRITVLSSKLGAAIR